MNSDLVAQNQESTKRLKELVTHLTEADLARSVGDGWTVATVLGHLAFWDRRAALLLPRWQREGITPELYDTSIINEASVDLWSAISPGAAAQLVTDSADAADTAIAALSAEMVQEILNGDTGVNLKRYGHREEHIEQIQRALQQP